MTDTPDPTLRDRIHPPVPATRAMPAGRIIGIVVDPAQRPWEIVLHETEQQYTLRTPPGFDGHDDTGIMIRTDYMTAGNLTVEFGIVVPKYVKKAIEDGRVSKGWEPGTHLFSTIAGVLKALPVHVFVEKLVGDTFNEMEGATQAKIEIPPAPWYQRAAEKLGTFVKPRKAAAPEEPKP